MTDPFSIGRRRHGRSDSGQHRLFLSVLLLLVAFFAIMVANSEYHEDRSRAALQSLGGVFARPAIGAISAIEGEVDARGGSERERGDWRVSLARSVGVRPIAEPPAGVAFGFDIDPQRLFEEPRPRLRRDTGLLLGRIARALASAGEGEVDRLQIMLNVRADRLGDLGEAALLTRLELLRRRLLELGAPVEAVEVGWTTAADDFWRLGFWAAPDGER